MDEGTSMYDIKKLHKVAVKKVIKEVFDILKERGYDPYNQLSGYLISGDPGYISNYKDARSKIIELDRSEIVKILLEEYITE